MFPFFKGGMCLQDRVRAMMEGALISGIFMVFMFMTIYTPLGIITALALPVPFTIYAARHGWRRSLLVVAVSSILTIIIGALPSVFSALFAGSLGTVMGSLYRTHKKASIAFIGGTLTNLIFFLLSLVASFYIFGINPITALQEVMRQSFETSQSIIERFGQVDAAQVEMLMGMVDMIATLIPMLLIVGSAQFAFINHWISRKMLQRLGTPCYRHFRRLESGNGLNQFCFIISQLSFFLCLLGCIRRKAGMSLFLLILNLFLIL